MNRTSTADQIYITHQLSVLISTGLTIFQSLGVLAGEKHSKKQAAFFAAAQEELSRGKTFGDYLSEIGGWNLFVIALVRVGEMSGTLGTTCSVACRELTERKDMQKKVLGALLYPACILVFATALITGIVGFVFPKILPVLQSVKGALPLPTRVVIFVAHVTTTYSIVIFVATLAVFTVLFFVYKKFAAARRFLERFILEVPFVGNLYRAYILSRLLKTLAVLTGAGVGLVDSLEKTADVTSSVLYGQACVEVQSEVAGGDQFSSSIAQYPRLFPSLCSNLVSVGERTGTFSEVAERIADMYSSQFKSALDQISKLIEPVIMVLLGCAVGFIAVSIISPIYEITSQVGR